MSTLTPQKSIRIRLARPEIDSAETDAISKVLLSGRLVQGPEVEAFENELSEFLGISSVVAVSSGTAALHLSMIAAGIGKGDIVFVPSFAWPSAANITLLIGALPVFVDCDPITFNISPESLRQKIEDVSKNNLGQPRAIIAVHEFGLPCDIDSIIAIADDKKLTVIEDAACALGANHKGRKVGTFGKMGIFSFHPRKSITTGEGGVIVTEDNSLSEELRALRNHGQINGKRYEFSRPGLNYRLTEIQAAMGRVQLTKLERIIARKRGIAKRYIKLLDKCKLAKAPLWHEDHTWQTFMVVLSDRVSRDVIIQKMAEQGIEVGPGAIAAHRLPMFCDPEISPDLLVSSKLADQGLALPLHCGLNDDEIEEVVSSLNSTLLECAA